MEGTLLADLVVSRKRHIRVFPYFRSQHLRFLCRRVASNKSSLSIKMFYNFLYVNINISISFCAWLR